MGRLTELQKVPLLKRPVRWLRRRRVIHRYLRIVADEILGATSDIAEIERRAAARLDVLYQDAARAVIERTDLLVQELDRKIEGFTARQAKQVRRLEQEVAALRETLERLEAVLGAGVSPPPGGGSPPSGGPSPTS